MPSWSTVCLRRNRVLRLPVSSANVETTLNSRLGKCIFPLRNVVKLVCLLPYVHSFTHHVQWAPSEGNGRKYIKTNISWNEYAYRHDSIHRMTDSVQRTPCTVLHAWRLEFNEVIRTVQSLFTPSHIHTQTHALGIRTNGFVDAMHVLYWNGSHIDFELVGMRIGHRRRRRWCRVLAVSTME